MNFIETSLPGAYLIELERVPDERGFFARTWCTEEFRLRGLNSNLAQCSLSSNVRRGTLRGMHFQGEPYAEAKLVRCCAGAIYDVLLDLRPASSTYLKWFAAELTADNHRMLYVPEGLAHGFQTLVDSSEVCYQISHAYRAEFSRGVRWNDPCFGIEWPLPDPILSSRDRTFSDYTS